jgi:hypothetical protein
MARSLLFIVAVIAVAIGLVNRLSLREYPVPPKGAYMRSCGFVYTLYTTPSFLLGSFRVMMQRWTQVRSAHHHTTSCHVCYASYAWALSYLTEISG